jgi:hypothetical protein
LVSARKFPQYEFPEALRYNINRGFKPFENMTPAVAQKLKEVR